MNFKWNDMWAPFIFVVNLIAYLAEAPIGYWVGVSFLLLTLISYKFFKDIKYKFPVGELASLVYLLQNSFALILLYLYVGKGNFLDSYYYCYIPVDEYLPFSILAINAFFIGVSRDSKFDYVWSDFILRLKNEVSTYFIVRLLGLGMVGSLLLALDSIYFNYIGAVLNSFWGCALVILILIGGKANVIYIVAGFFFTLFQLFSGMFGAPMIIIFYLFVMIILKQNLVNRKVLWKFIFPFFVLSVIGFAFLQNIKGDYREAVWIKGENADMETFSKVASRSQFKQSVNPLEIEFYLPILFRLNQAAIVSETVLRVPAERDFEHGRTLMNSFVDALIPRFINPDKEQSGGFLKLKEYTYRVLRPGTSMNIGFLGEAYVNFGKNGSVILFLFLGFIIAFLRDVILKLASKKLIVLVFFPVYLNLIINSEGDFLNLFNGIIKASIVIYAALFVLQKYEKNLS